MSDRNKRRKQRVPVGGRRLNMTVDPSLIPNGTVPRWVNDIGGNIERYLEGGYEFIYTKKRGVFDKVGDDNDNKNTDLGSRVSMVVDKTGRLNQEPVKAYLMCIKKEWFEDDKKLKREGIDKIDSQIRTGLDGIKEDRGHFNADIKYTA